MKKIVLIFVAMVTVIFVSMSAHANMLYCTDKSDCYETVFERAAQALIRMEEPDFSDLNEKLVKSAFSALVKEFNPEQDWLNYLRYRVSVLSGGQVKLVEADYRTFPIRIMGQAAYLLLIKGEIKTKVIVTPTERYITFR